MKWFRVTTAHGDSFPGTRCLVEDADGRQGWIGCDGRNYRGPVRSATGGSEEGIILDHNPTIAMVREVLGYTTK